MKIDSNEEWPFLEENQEGKCCAETSPEENKPEDCLGSWKEEKKTAENAYKVAFAKEQQAEGIFVEASSWEKKLKTWFENAQNAHEKAVYTYEELELFIMEVNLLTQYTSKTSKAIQALLCLIKYIFDELHDLIQEGTETDGTDLINKLKEYIRCLDKLDEKKKVMALDCVKDFETKVWEIYALQSEILNKLLEMLAFANALVSDVKNEENLGLLWQLTDLQKRLIQEVTSIEKTRACKKSPEKPSDQGDNSDIESPCNVDFTKPPVQILPIRQMKSVENSEDSPYYKNLEKLYEQAKDKSEKLNEVLQKAKEENNKMLARKISLQAAINAAEASEKSK